ncbi:MAG: BREX-1 system adenine-specific DNA-methyltransferase PglX [Tissierellaceae bacterium]|nr:BREX-1 system adenine-specific DNA-methyltransferase PglX [Tissierellaceae bacterium]
MNKSALRNFATDARRELIEKVKLKALQLGITEEDIKKETLQSSDSVFIEGRQLTIEERSQRNKLIEEIKIKGYNQVIEEVAYTWFNRFTALRFMEVNNYLPTKVKVLSSENEDSYEPDIVKEALNIDLDIDRELVYKLKTSSDNDAIDKLYKHLIIKQCNALNDILPLMFEKILDYTELLFPDGLLSDRSFLRVMTDTSLIPESNWENVEVIGWLYQYYISERKDEVFAGLKKNKKITKDDIAPATQLFTPHWIVRYMVENSVGKLWQEGHPNEDLKKKWKYYIEPAEQDEEVQRELDKLKEESMNIKVEDIKVIDPSMGSGHILVYAFDLLYDIYLSEGYIAHDIPKLILEKNLYGIDIDERAFQLAYFALMMKGRSKSRRFFNQSVDVNIIPIGESNEFPKEAIKYFSSSKSLDMEKQIVEKDLEYLVDVFHDAKEYGSILKVEKINFELIERRLDELRNKAPVDVFELQYRDKILEIIPSLVKQAKIMSDKYDVLVTNPPYMGSRGMNPKLSCFLNEEYPDTKLDLFAVFMELDEHLVKSRGYMAMINQHSWMFLSSFEKYRDRLLRNRTIDTMLHLGARAFEEIGGEVVQSTTFVNRKFRLGEYKGTYIRLLDFNTSYAKKENTVKAIIDDTINYRYISKTVNYEKIPGSPIAYWVSKSIIKSFVEAKKIGDIANVVTGMSTGDNSKYLRIWHEISDINLALYQSNIDSIDLNKTYWIPYNKGGEARKWFGNNDYVVKWSESENFHRPRPTFKNLYLKEGLTWSFITSGMFSVRYYPKGFLWDVAGSPCVIEDEILLNYVLGFLCTKIANDIIKIINPTLNCQVVDIQRLPIVIMKEYFTSISLMVSQNIRISKFDWDSFETSWDFMRHPIINKKLRIDKEDPDKENTIDQAFNNWRVFTENQFNQLKANEEELNRLFIEIYGLEEELTPEVEDKDVTISKVVEEKLEEDRKNSCTIDRAEAIQSFISFGVGCMLGRYSLDEEGLVYAGGDFDLDKYKTFPVYKDNIIPILSESYFEDDIVTRFIEFVKVTFGEETLNENLKYIADSLKPRINETSRETIRRYFTNDFYKDHVKTYRKRPIYWLFTSGKEKAFNALIYMHRYDVTTLARIRTDYLHPLQSRLDNERVNILNLTREEDISVREKRQYEKELKDIEKKIDELKAYDERLHHMADKMIKIDLDDGVKVNYEIFKGLVQKI